jgi:hypothetical protein
MKNVLRNIEIKFQEAPYLNFLDSVSKDIKSIDKQNILGQRRGFLEDVLATVKSFGLDYSKIVLFEAGSGQTYNFDEEKDYLFNSNVSHFFANYPQVLDYFGYDIVLDRKDYNKLFKVLKYDEGKKNFLDNLKKQWVFTFGDFKNKIYSTFDSEKIPFIISNLVLGVTKGEDKFDFWNLPGVQIHEFLPMDLFGMWQMKGGLLGHNNFLKSSKENYNTQEFFDGYVNFEFGVNSQKERNSIIVEGLKKVYGIEKDVFVDISRDYWGKYYSIWVNNL